MSRRTLHILVSTLLTLFLLVSLATPALAETILHGEDTPTFGADMQRDRRINSSAPLYQGYALYNPQAKFYPLGPGLQSYSTPTDYTASDGTTVVLQYAFEGEDGYLYGLKEANNSITSLWGGPVAFATDSAQEAAGVSGPTTSFGYTAIGVGTYLYVWPNQYFSGQTDAASIPGGVRYRIDGNPGNTLYQVAMSPAITGAVSWTGYDGNLNPVTWTAPAAAVGSWDGGFISRPVKVPTNVMFLSNQIDYYTTQTDPSSGTANITSSPAFNPDGYARIGTNGDGALAFGVSGITDPWMVIMDPATGQVKTFGGGPGQKQVFAAGISSSPVFSNN